MCVLSAQTCICRMMYVVLDSSTFQAYNLTLGKQCIGDWYNPAGAGVPDMFETKQLPGEFGRMSSAIRIKYLCSMIQPENDL